jgi:hypothetical protein
MGFLIQWTGVKAMRKLMIRMIRAYQRGTAGKNPTCKYLPTCSNYAIDAYENYNFFYATLLMIWRILRCNPFSRGGYDPIPKYKKELKDPLRIKKDPE